MDAMRFIAVLLVGCCCAPGSLALRMYGVTVPSLKIRGDEAYLRCNYRNDDDSLLSVTWFKDGVEFYRYVLNKPEPRYVITEVPGIIVDEWESGEMYLQLNSLTLPSAGEYRCDIANQTDTYSANSSMVIVAPPEADPEVTGFEESVWVPNGILPLNCTAGKSFPAAVLNWTIHGVEANESMLTWWPTETDEEGLESTKLGLNLQLGPDPINSEPIEVTCTATVTKHHVELSEQSASVTDLYYSREKSVTVGNYGAVGSQPSCLLVTVLLLTVGLLGGRSGA